MASAPVALASIVSAPASVPCWRRLQISLDRQWTGTTLTGDLCEIWGEIWGEIRLLASRLVVSALGARRPAKLPLPRRLLQTTLPFHPPLRPRQALRPSRRNATRALRCCWAGARRRARTMHTRLCSPMCGRRPCRRRHRPHYPVSRRARTSKSSSRPRSRPSRRPSVAPKRLRSAPPPPQALPQAPRRRASTFRSCLPSIRINSTRVRIPRRTPIGRCFRRPWPWPWPRARRRPLRRPPQPRWPFATR